MKKEYSYALISIFLWSTLATAAKLLLGEFNHVQILCVSSLIAGLTLFIINIMFRRIKICKGYKLKDYLTMIIIGLPGTFLYYIFYYAGAAKLPASQAFIINYMWPIMSIIFACLILKEKLTLRKIVAIILSFVGVVFVAGRELLIFERHTFSGILLCLTAAIFYGLFTALNKKIEYDSCLVMMISFLTAFVLTTIIIVVKRDFFVVSSADFLGLVWNGVFTMAIPNTLWLVAFNKGNTAKISNLAYITPFLSMIWTTVVLKEPFHLFSLIGLAIMVGGIFIQLKESTIKKEDK